MKKPNQKEVFEALGVLAAFFAVANGKSTPNTVKAKAGKETPLSDDLNLGLGGDATESDGLNLDLGDGLGNEITDAPDPRFAELKKQLVKLAAVIAKKHTPEEAKSATYQILDHFGCKTVDVVDPDDLDKILTITKNNIKKYSKK